MEKVASVPCPGKRKIIEPFRLLCRLLRHEIRGFALLADGSKVVVTRSGAFWGTAEDIILKPASYESGFEALNPPMTVTVDSNENILWGEYWGNAERKSVRIFFSETKGKTYRVVYEFPPKQIRHIHNIIEDPYASCYWVLAGDHNDEPGIGRLSKDFKDFEWLAKGLQQHRAVNLFIMQDKMIYGTDTEKENSYINVIDKKSGKVEHLQEIPGSCIYGTRFGKWHVISTSIEYFEGQKYKDATLWISDDMLNWKQVYKARKDMWSMKYFQFGSIVLPRNTWENDEIIFSGQALEKIDNKVYIAEIE
jgi:hypothetical protein